MDIYNLKKKRGRKPSGVSKARKQKKIYFSDEEWSKIKVLSLECSMGCSEYIRKRALGYKPMVFDPELRAELFKIRTDIVKLFTAIHSQDFPGSSRLDLLFQTDFLMKWTGGVDKELKFIDKLINLL